MSFDLNALMKQAQEMQAQMEQMQEEASKETAEGSAGGGMVTSSHNPWNWNGVKFKVDASPLRAFTSMVDWRASFYLYGN